MSHPIPHICVLTLNRPDLLQRLIDSIDYPVENFSILFQGGCQKRPNINSNIKNMILYESEFNVGVSRGWNYLLKQAAADEYYIVIGDDNYFAPGSLSRIATNMSILAGDSIFINFRMRAHNGGKWGDNEETFSGFSAYIFVRGFEEKLGWFDENIYPAYFEDTDMHYRLVLSGCSSQTMTDVIIISGDDSTTGSCTLNSSDNETRKKIDKCFENNRDYVREKWGWENEKFIYKHPFNNAANNYREQIKHRNYSSQQISLLGHDKECNYIIVKHD